MAQVRSCAAELERVQRLLVAVGAGGAEHKGFRHWRSEKELQDFSMSASPMETLFFFPPISSFLAFCTLPSRVNGSPEKIFLIREILEGSNSMTQRLADSPNNSTAGVNFSGIFMEAPRPPPMAI